MIICRTPFRISFFGGSTDYPEWYRVHGGATLGTAINKYCYISCRFLPPFFEHRIRLVYSVIENCQTISEIKHPAARAVLGHLAIDRGVEIHHDADLPARSGIGSSSAFTVGLLHAGYALGGHMASKDQLARESIYIEQDVLRETVGCQDQVLAAYGGFNRLTFPRAGEIEVHPVTLPEERIELLESHLMLFYTGISRTASSVAETYVPHLRDAVHEGAMQTIRAMVDDGLGILCGGRDIGPFGPLLHEAWDAKRELGSNVSNAEVETIYQHARRAGATGGKLIGAGGGGFLLLFVPPSEQVRVREALSALTHVPFRFEFGGSQILFADREEDYAASDRQRVIQQSRSIEIV
jgi:D-glycero-alpha-D-manno-heptose-7-phosphate kinase